MLGPELRSCRADVQGSELSEMGNRGVRARTLQPDSLGSNLSVGTQQLCDFGHIPLCFYFLNCKMAIPITVIVIASSVRFIVKIK